MTFDQLPERLRNINGLQLVTGERVTVALSESTIQMLEPVLLPLLEKGENQKRKA